MCIWISSYFLHPAEQIMMFKKIKNHTTLLVSFIFFASFPVVEAQEDANIINWYYSTMFGTGYYKVGDTRVGIIQMPFSYTFKTTREKQDDYGIKLLVPVSAGFHSFDFNDIFDLPNNVATLSIVPGIELEYLISESWVLKPYINAGVGKEFTQNIWSWIYGAGIKSRWILPFQEGEFTLGNSLNYAGYSASEGSTRAMISFVTGLNWVTPLNFTLFNRNTNLGTHFVYYGYLNEIDFVEENNESFKVRNEFEIALTLGTHKPRSFLGFDYARYGLAFRYGENLRAVRLVSDFPF